MFIFNRGKNKRSVIIFNGKVKNLYFITSFQFCSIPLRPGEKSPFNIYIDEDTGDKVKAFEVSLTWTNPDGEEEYIENVDVVEDASIYDIFEEDEKSNKLTDEEIERLGLFSTVCLGPCDSSP